MTAGELLLELRSRGVELQVVGDKLRYTPPAAVTPELREKLAANKSEVMAMLMEQAETCPSCGAALRVIENERFREVECPTLPLHFYRLTNKHPSQPMGIFASETVSQVWGELVGWVESTIPKAAEMRAYLNMEHADNFGQAELEALRRAEDDIDKILVRIQREEASDELTRLLDEAKEHYRRVWRRIEELFGRTYPATFTEESK